jgi:ferredoxin
VDNEKCNGCEECVPWCFFDAIAIKEVPGLDTPKAVINAENCVGCGLCVLKCGPEAITMELVRPPEFIPETIAGPSSIVH